MGKSITCKSSCSFHFIAKDWGIIAILSLSITFNTTPEREDAISVSLDQRSENYDELDERAAWFYEAITVSRGMKSTIPGFG
ncbi:hypothetical protein, partial [Vibrio parahaemolyticus]